MAVRNTRPRNQVWNLRLAVGLAIGCAALCASAQPALACATPRTGTLASAASASFRSLAVTPTDTTIPLGCPFPQVRGRPRLDVRVVAWCALPAVRGQAQFKFKLRVKNTGDRALDIRLERWRLLVRTFAPGRWSPPRIGATTVARPFAVNYGGRRTWAVPANVNGSFDLIRAGEGTYASHWNGTVLLPGETYLERGFGRGDLVFYVPQTGGEVPRVVGLAYFAGNRPFIVVPPKQWGPRLPGSAF